MIIKGVILYYENAKIYNICKRYDAINTFELIVNIENYRSTQTVEVKDEMRVQIMAIRHMGSL